MRLKILAIVALGAVGIGATFVAVGGASSSVAGSPGVTSTLITCSARGVPSTTAVTVH